MRMMVVFNGGDVVVERERLEKLVVRNKGSPEMKFDEERDWKVGDTEGKITWKTDIFYCTLCL